MTAYYNEKDPAAAAVLRELIGRDVIAPGDVDDRSIQDVQPNELSGYTQCHFFAGGGLWSVAARLAGWPDGRELWTGSCPCQPFSQAGKRAGTDDPRHLWPDFHRLIRSRRPPVVMGEQVAGKDGYSWFDGVRSDLAGEDYAGRAIDIPVCAIDGPHQRNRLYWIAVANYQKFGGRTGLCEDRSQRHGPVSSNSDVVLADADCGGRDGWPEVPQRSQEERTTAERVAGSLQPYADLAELQGQPSAGQQPLAKLDARPLRNGSWWSDYEWIVSPLDSKARRAKSGIPFLVDGLLGRVDLWRIGGNAISPVLAAEVIAAFLDAEAAAASTLTSQHLSGEK